MDAAVIRCAACGGSVAPDDVQCRSCGSQVATVACPGCMAMVDVHARHCQRCGATIAPPKPRPTDLACPECRSAKLARTRVGEVEVDQCLHCGGVWLEQALFETISADKEIRSQALGVLPTATTQIALTVEIHYRPCPTCARMMNRYNYARISGVIVDGCKSHGLWFDRDELRKVLEFIAGGGLEKSRAREIERLDDAARNLAQATRMQMASPPSTAADFGLNVGQPSLGASLLSGLMEGLMDHFIL